MQPTPDSHYTDCVGDIMPKPLGTYALINSTTLTSAQASITFSDIPGTFTDLVLVSRYGLSADADSQVYVNGVSTGTSYSETFLRGNGSTASSGRRSNQPYWLHGLAAVTVPTTLTSVVTHQFLDYSNTTTNKTLITRINDAGAQVAARVGLYTSTSAITSITIAGISANLLSGSTFRLFGITAGNQ